MKSALFQKPYLPHGVLALVIMGVMGLHNAHGQTPNEPGEVWRCYRVTDFNKTNAVVTLYKGKIDHIYDLEKLNDWFRFLGEAGRIVKQNAAKAIREKGYSETIRNLVEVQGFTYYAGFSWDGLVRRWNFGRGFNYSFFIQPGGVGLYYDFSGREPDESVTPQQVFECDGYVLR